MASENHRVGPSVSSFGGYESFGQINGDHPFKSAVRGGYVEYSVRTRKGGKLLYFNFNLAKEIGLISRDHPVSLTPGLRDAVLKTFSLQIINEYDIAHGLRIPQKQIRPHRYMATRYLQLQHPDKKGLTSGDGRSIWNGTYKNHRERWDFSTCGSGVTRLSPATSLEHRFFRTGGKNVAYGDGRQDLCDGIDAALMSEIFHRNGIRTERTLAVIAYPDRSCLTIRAGKNLLRPAHFFMHLKQGDYRGLKRAVDYYIDRQVENGEWPEIREEKKRYLDLLERTTLAFARAAAQFENEYIFCWLEWDGDNILADAGIIDYGSVRQFGLFHHDYRYDDVDRFSTTITEQKNKAKYLIQTFAQQTDFLITGKKRNLGRFKQHPSVKKFLIAFEAAKDEGMLYRIGFDRDTSDLLLGSRQDRRTVRRFRTLVRYFENVRTRRGRHPVADGITWDAIFCVRDILRELPLILLERNKQCSPDEFIGILRSEYATKSDLRIGAGRKRKIREFQEVYSHLIRRAARLKRVGPDKILTTVSGRSQLINRYSRLTGQSAILVSKRIVRESKRLSANSINRMMHEFITEQVLRPEARASVLRPSGSNRLHETRSALKALHETVKECRDSI